MGLGSLPAAAALALRHLSLKVVAREGWAEYFVTKMTSILL
jgi:hypothetical protein